MTETATRATPTRNDHFVAIRNVIKRFPGVVALRGISFNVTRGEIHALVGENGAGKSTLIKILAGAYAPDEGTVLLNGEQVVISSPHRAQELGITTIHQEMTLAPHLTALENIFLGRELCRGRTGILRAREMETRVKSLCTDYSFDTADLHRPIEDFGALKKHVVMLLKALAFRAELVIMDEPTAGLTDTERRALFVHMRQLKERGVAVLWVTHRLDELVEVADRATVLRDGGLVGTIVPSETEIDQIVAMMVGREVESIEALVSAATSARSTTSVESLLQVEGLNRGGVLRDISFELAPGEVLGIGGLAGAGRTELARAIMGVDRIDGGRIYLAGREITIRSPRDAYHAGIALVPEDRKTQGMFGDFSVAENVTISGLWRIVRGRFVIDRRRERAAATRFVDDLRIRTPNIRQKIAFLSGGNQQKSIIARALFTEPKVLILDEPTQGIDVGAKVEIVRLILDHTERGGGAIVISSEIPELLGVCDRVLVMREGRIAGELRDRPVEWTTEAAHAREEILMAIATGATNGSHA